MQTDVHENSSYTLTGMAGVAIASVGAIIMYKKFNKKSASQDSFQRF
jgi:hypothetical protein